MRRAPALVALAVVLVVACVRHEGWFVIECGSTADCAQTAGIQCPDGYVLGDKELVGSDTHGARTRLVHEQRVRCESDGGTVPPKDPYKW